MIKLLTAEEVYNEFKGQKFYFCYHCTGRYFIGQVEYGEITKLNEYEYKFTEIDGSYKILNDRPRYACSLDKNVILNEYKTFKSKYLKDEIDFHNTQLAQLNKQLEALNNG